MLKLRKISIFAVLVLLVVMALTLGIVSFANEEATPTVSIEYQNLSYQANVQIKYAVAASNVPDGAKIGIRVRKGTPDAEKVYEAVYEGTQTIYGEKYYVFKFLDISADEMTLDVYATPYFEAEGEQTVFGETKKNSVLSYALSGLSDDSGAFNENVKTLLNSMLRYGAAAQKYSEKHLDRLATDTFYYIQTVDCTFADGFSFGLYPEGATAEVLVELLPNKTAYIESSAGDKFYADESGVCNLTVGASNETYTAKYEERAGWTISYELDGGTNPTGAPTVYDEGETVVLPTPTKTGYTFLGWYTTSGFDGDAVSEISADDTGNKTFYANWISDVEYELLEKLEAQRDEVGSIFGTSTQNIGTSDYSIPADVTLSNSHPRLLLTRNDITLVKSKLSDNNATNARFLELIETTLVRDGKLNNGSSADQPYSLTTSSNVEGYGLQNGNTEWLEIIQAKALAYLIYGEKSYGYEAILYIKNYLLTLDIQSVTSNQERYYGMAMFTAALVYDWCYDLLTDEDKEQIIAGVEWQLCRKTTYNGAAGNVLTEWSEGAVYAKNASGKIKIFKLDTSEITSVKAMSVGFPPTIANTITGHGCERQILRDYLSFAVAIYGENDSWWKNIGGIVYGQLVPPRDFYFKSGVAHQGPYYSSGRHISDLYSAWILKVATDSIPYTGIENTVRGFLGYEISAGLMFDDGDGHTGGEGLDIATYKSLAFITAYLFGDGGMLAQAEHLLGDAAFSNDVSGLTSPLYVALRGLCDIDAATDRYSGMPLIQYNGSPLGQYIIRQAWNSADSATVFMRIKEVTTGNHEHEDTGTFQIYYKGMLTNDGGVYNNYGHVQTRYYYSSTIAHNGLIVFDPNKSSYGDSSAKDNVKWYSGGQKRASEESQTNGRYFLDDNGAVTAHYQRGEIVGRQHGYDNVGTPLYAYIAGNITKAYDSATVNYVGRRMLTVYTGDADFPMVFFVYDDITSDSASYEKRFLLQITSPNAPTIKGQYDAWNGTAYVTEGNAVASGEFASITTENGGGRLVLTSLSDNVKFRLAGGRNEGAYRAADSFNYTVIVQHNGQLTPVQCVPLSNTADDGHWGRVEIVSTAGSTDAKFMNVLYVTDAGQTKTAPAVTEITNKNGLEGGSFAGVAALFATSRTRATSTLSATVSGDGDMSYYVSGVAAGEWEITVDGTSYGTAIATEEGGLLTFTAPAGQVVITPAN